MDDRDKGTTQQSAQPTPKGGGAGKTALKGIHRSRYFRRGLVLLAVVSLYAIAAGLEPAAGTNSNQDRTPPSNNQELIKEQVMNENSTSDDSDVSTSHHISLNVSQRSSSTSSSASITSDANSNSSTASVVVNGQHIVVPQNGSVHRTIQGDGGKAQVDIDVNNSGSGTASSNSSMNVDVTSSSESNTDTGGP